MWQQLINCLMAKLKLIIEEKKLEYAENRITFIE